MSDEVWWYSRIEYSRPQHHNISMKIRVWNGQSPAELSRCLRSRTKPMPRNNLPKLLYSEPEWDIGNIGKLNDLFPIGMSGTVMSHACHELLRQFDLGKTESFELPLFGGKRLHPIGSEPNFDMELPGRWHLLHLIEEKDTVLLEKSPGLYSVAKDLTGHYGPTFPYEKDLEIVLSRDALNGVDLWRERELKTDLWFVSGRLKLALEASELKLDNIVFHRCRLV